MPNYAFTQDIFGAISQLGALCATPGIDDKTKEVCNEQIRELLALLKPTFKKMSAEASGLKLT